MEQCNIIRARVTTDTSVSLHCQRRLGAKFDRDDCEVLHQLRMARDVIPSQMLVPRRPPPLYKFLQVTVLNLTASSQELLNKSAIASGIHAQTAEILVTNNYSEKERPAEK